MPKMEKNPIGRLPMRITNLELEHTYQSPSLGMKLRWGQSLKTLAPIL